MDLKKFFVFLLIILSNSLFGQQSLNNYKYIIVPKKYDFLKSENQYQMNSLTKFLFKKEGFIALFDTDARPQELASNPCLGLTSKVVSNSGLFSTKLKIELVDCRNEIIFTSSDGKSKQKDYKKAYHEALRNSFKSISDIHYSYHPESIKKMPDEELVEVKDVVIEEPTDKDEISDKKGDEIIEVVEDNPLVEDESPEVEEVALPVPPNSQTVPKLADPVKEETAIQTNSNTNVLYAQKNALGYQLVDSTPKVVYVLLKSSRENVYFLRNTKGILYQENGQWIVEYYDLDQLVRKSLTIKF